jgi:hypothetical protein
VKKNVKNNTKKKVDGDGDGDSRPAVIEVKKRNDKNTERQSAYPSWNVNRLRVGESIFQLRRARSIKLR